MPRNEYGVTCFIWYYARRDELFSSVRRRGRRCSLGKRRNATELERTDAWSRRHRGLQRARLFVCIGFCKGRRRKIGR